MKAPRRVRDEWAGDLRLETREEDHSTRNFNVLFIRVSRTWKKKHEIPNHLSRGVK